MDGTLGSQTALLAGRHGVEITSAEELADIVARRGTDRLAGGGACDRRPREPQRPRRLRADGAEWRPRGLRHRIEHAQCLAPEDVERFTQIGIAASVQFSHAPSTVTWRAPLARAARPRLRMAFAARLRRSARERLRRADRGARPAGRDQGRRPAHLDERPAWRPEQAVTVEEALHATCVAPAWLTGEEHRRGKLLPGYLADLVVLDRDP